MSYNYNPSSKKAEEFINHEEILETLSYAEKNKNNVELIDRILAKARLRKGLSHREAAVLLDCEIPEKVEEIFELICTIQKQGKTVLLIEQNANMALKIADYAYVLETGNITKSGTGAELLADESIKEAYLGKKKS